MPGLAVFQKQIVPGPRFPNELGSPLTQNPSKEESVEGVAILGRQILRRGRVEQAHSCLVLGVHLLDTPRLGGECRDRLELLGHLEGGREGREAELGPGGLRLVGNGQVLQARPGTELWVEVLDYVSLPRHCHGSGGRGLGGMENRVYWLREQGVFFPLLASEFE